MSAQQFDSVVREAIWTAHHRKCAYTSELVDLASMHIDHIIPETMAADPEALSAMRVRLQLAPEFSLSGLENLLPAKPGPNLRKGDAPLSDNATTFFLALAAQKKSDIEQNIVSIRRRIDTGRTLVMVKQLLDAGKIDQAEVARLLTSPVDEVFRLAAQGHWLTDPELLAIRKADVAELKTRPVRMGDNDNLNHVTLSNDAGEKRLCSTCTEYEAARREGFYSLTTFDMKMEVFFAHQCGLLTALEKAALPTVSYLAEPRIGISDLHLLPFTMFPQLGDGADPVSHETYADKVQDETLAVRRVGTGMLVVEGLGMGQQLVEVVRADFDGDGVEDILLFEYCYATGGTMGFGGVRVFSRLTSSGVLSDISDRVTLAPH